MKYNNIGWVHPEEVTSSYRKLLMTVLHSIEMSPFDVKNIPVPKGSLIKKTKTKFGANMENLPQFEKLISKNNCDFLVINDKAALGFITKGKRLSLNLCRGSVYIYELKGKRIPCLVLDDLYKCKLDKVALWVLNHDVKKLHRWLNGNLRPYAQFDYKVCHTLQDVLRFHNDMLFAKVVSVDIETSVGCISSLSYTIITQNNSVFTYVIPIIDSTVPDGCYWDEETEIKIWKLIIEVNEMPVLKVLQNGAYDSSYFLKYNAPLRNYIADSQHGIHAIWCEVYKRLDFIASIAIDEYQYWKDEGKEDAKDDSKTRIPKTKEGLENYWRYNALDTHNTLFCWLYISKLLAAPGLEWALINYTKEMEMQLGPALAMTMRGITYDTDIHAKEMEKLSNKATKLEEELLEAVPVQSTTNAKNPFNFRSPKDMPWLLYDVFKLKEYRRKGRTTNKDVLKMIKSQNIFAEWVIDKVIEMKVPANNVSKYKENIGIDNLLLYSISAGSTDTTRFASSTHPFNCGVNIQNVPYEMRNMVSAPKGYLLWDLDYSQSDAYFTAHDMQDEKFIETMMGDKDAHCVHAAYFFKMDYDELYERHKKKDPLISHNVTGIRSVTKRIVYGANYLMSAPTLFQTMGRAPVIAAAKALGFKDAGSWTDKKLIQLCEYFLLSYFKMYPNLQPELENKIGIAVANRNIATCYGGATRMFLGNLKSDPSVQRQFAAFFGQGGTAQNINKAAHNLYWSEDGIKLEQEGARLCAQVHDSLVGLIPETRLDLIPEIKRLMENECELHGKKFVVPVEGDVGRGWGNRLLAWSESLTLQQIDEKDNKWKRENNFI